MNIKKIVAGVLACCIVVGVIPAIENVTSNTVITASAEDEAEYTEGTYEQLTYINYGDYIKISDCDETATEVVIPAEIDGLPVTSIGWDTFYSCENLTSVTIPDSVISIGAWAFGCCTSLTSIEIPDSVTIIEYSSFWATGLTSITIPASVTNIENLAFEACPDLTSITILNPECEIFDTEYVIFNGVDDNDNPYYNGTIYGYENSTAQAYAEKYGRKFESLGEAPEKELSMGDINSDGIIDASDSSLILAEYSLLSTSDSGTFTESMKKSADVNKDGLIDSIDSSLILSYYGYASTGGTDTIENFLESSENE